MWQNDVKKNEYKIDKKDPISVLEAFPGSY